MIDDILPNDKSLRLPAVEGIETLPCQFGDYELLEEISRGGMGVIYKARQISQNRVVAVKMILTGQLDREPDIQRFYTEAEATGRLQHPGIGAIHEVGVFDRQYYFSMEYVEGQSLAAIVRESPLSPKTGAEYLQKIAEAVHYAHEQGILHLDLKPSKVLIDANGQPRVTDFGLANLAENDPDLIEAGVLFGTPTSYISPEQASGCEQELDRTTDVYSLGVILYEVLTGVPPFRGPTALDTLAMIQEVKPVPPRALAPRIPRDLEAICLKCLEKDPHDRYAMAENLAAELTRFLQRRPIHARPIGRLQGFWLWCRRNPAIAISMAIAASLLLLLAIGGPIVAVRLDSLSWPAEPTAANERPAREEQADAPAAIAPFAEAEAKELQRLWAEKLGVPLEKKDPFGIELVLIPPGEFAMGSPVETQQRFLQEAEAANDAGAMLRITMEVPQHPVRITQPFYLGKYEVTQAQWEAVMGANPAEFQNPTNPVERVSWERIQVFLETLNRMNENEGVIYGLPTKAQWKYACRAGTASAYCFGDSNATLGEFAWFHSNAEGMTHRVGQLRPNAWGLYDMYGNVAEWCEDSFVDDFYAQSPLNDPLALGLYHRVIRGGTYGSGTWMCRSAFRRRGGPALGHPMQGFRVACVFENVVERGPFDRQAIGQQ